MVKIYIAGCGGMLGEAFYREFGDGYVLKCTDIDVNEGWLSYLDFRDYETYREDVKRFRPDWLFHLGAYTDLEYCELHPDDTYNTNTKSVEHATKIARELDIPLLYIGTAGIFNGQKEVYVEQDEPDPLGHYAKSKCLGERYVQKNAKEYLICRAGWMMGGGPEKDKKFIKKIMCQIKDGANELFIVNDKLGTPTYTHDFARNVKLLIEKGQRGLFNMVCGGLTSRLEVTTELLALSGMDDKIKVSEVSSEYFVKEYFVNRPDSEQLINKRLDDMGLNIMRNWKAALQDYLRDYYSGYLNGNL
jgi:dTDP-4-dehydrorhamnose reductase